MKAAGNMRPGLRASLQSEETILAPRLGAEIEGRVQFASERRKEVVILWQPTRFSHELLCEVS
jgi:hypothetical protein